jgi:AcrR family transcriptional regulator
VTVADVEMGRRERKKRDTRRALASVAVRLAAEKGPDQVTIEEIANGADVSVRTFFNYFPSKEAAIVGDSAEGRALLIERLLARPPEEPPFTAIRAAICGMYENGIKGEWADQRVLRQQLVRRFPALLPHHLASHHELDRALCQTLAGRMGVDQADDLYLALITTTAVHAMRLAVTRWEEQGRSPALSVLLDEVFDALERGLTPPPPRKKGR